MKLLKFECVKFICHSPHCTHAPVIDKWKVVASISLLDRGLETAAKCGETFSALLPAASIRPHFRCSTDTADDERQRFARRWPGVRLSGPVESATRMENSGREKRENAPHFYRPNAFWVVSTPAGMPLFHLTANLCVQQQKTHRQTTRMRNFSGWKIT